MITGLPSNSTLAFRMNTDVQLDAQEKLRDVIRIGKDADDMDKLLITDMFIELLRRHHKNNITDYDKIVGRKPHQPATNTYVTQEPNFFSLST